MFKSLKEKLGKAIGIFSKKVVEDAEVVAEESSTTLVEEVEPDVIEFGRLGGQPILEPKGE